MAETGGEKNHRMAWFGSDHKDHPIPIPLVQAGLPTTISGTDQAAWNPIQPGLGEICEDVMLEEPCIKALRLPSGLTVETSRSQMLELITSVKAAQYI